jgi:hypothetical protein
VTAGLADVGICHHHALWWTGRQRNELVGHLLRP